MDFPQPDPEPRSGTLQAPATRSPAANYGTLGPGCDVGSHVTSAEPGSGSRPVTPRSAELAAVVVGVVLALAVGGLGSAHAAWSRFSKLFTIHGGFVSTATASATGSPELAKLEPQKQAEALLEQAVAQTDGAVEQISARIDGWQGRLQWDPQVATLTQAALNSNDMRVRQSGIEVELAAYGLSKNSRSLEYLLKTAGSSDHAQKIWALWALGLMGNRGVEPTRVAQVLSNHLKDEDEDSRHWAVQGLALVGSSDTIPILLGAMHDDASPVVREGAACGLAQSGMFTREQRLSAVPKLLAYTDDVTLDSQTHSWAFQALTEITGQHLPDDPAAWRNWYASQH